MREQIIIRKKREIFLDVDKYVIDVIKFNKAYNKLKGVQHIDHRCQNNSEVQWRSKYSFKGLIYK